MRASRSLLCWRCVSFSEEKAGTVLPVAAASFVGGSGGEGGQASTCSRITPSSSKTSKINKPPLKLSSLRPSTFLPSQRRSFSTSTIHTPSLPSFSSASSFDSKRSLTNYVRGETPTGINIRYPIPSKIVGIYQTRGQRSYQEDTVLSVALQLPPLELQASLRSATESGTRPRKFGEKREMARGWEIQAGTAGEVGLFGIFDGHGGVEVSEWLRDHLAETIEDTKLEDAKDVVEYMKGLGGYFQRFKGGILSSRLTQPANPRQPPALMTLAERATIGFLKADREILTTIPISSRCGSTASIAFLHSLDFPSAPFFQARRLSITIAHCGDTRILLCQTLDGTVLPLTEKHHAEARVEAARLRRFGMGAGGSIVDAFGESRWMGAVENTRSMGDGRWKPTGVTSEPQVTSRVIDGTAHAFLIFVTDGISATISDQEIIDLCRTAPTPAIAARTVVNFASDAGSEDNCSVMVVPLAGWGKIGGTDTTRERRDWRRKEVEDTMGRDRRGGGG